ncbi:helix-turn-helix domain-containing protein [Pseudophaeobacter sp.]|uniref:helix-turn-helix domain-containing protein n=1 Tax=Pseudophaeobacter sp. TaxID=1971739 RepID=UPI004058E835
MEIVDTLGTYLFLGDTDVSSGAQWRSNMSDGLWFGCMLHGELSIEENGSGKTVWSKGDHALFSLGQSSEIQHEALASSNLKTVFLHIPSDKIEQTLGSEFTDICEAHHPGEIFSIEPSRGAHAETVRALAWQILSCPLTGPMRRCYLTGKSLEMMAVALEPASQMLAWRRSGQVSAGRVAPRKSISAHGAEKDKSSTFSKPRKASKFRAMEMEALHAARDIILKNLHAPSTIQELAAAVAMNPRKLSDGFAELFGSPIYTFTKDKRLAAARLRIEAGETCVSQVAYSMGYTPSHFATEFKKRYGVSPKAFAQNRTH